MPRREPPKTRRPPSRDPRRSVLIVVGARETEKAYFNGLRSYFRLPTVAMRIVEKAESPDKLVRYAEKNFDRDEYDDVWCVTDVDHFEREGAKVTAALKIGGEARIGVAVSNPCFELWLLLHHEDCRTFCADYDAVERRLKKHLPKYNKSRLRFPDFADGVEQAVAYARDLDPTGTAHTRNPSTGMWKLVESILEQR